MLKLECKFTEAKHGVWQPQKNSVWHIIETKREKWLNKSTAGSILWCMKYDAWNMINILPLAHVMWYSVCSKYVVPKVSVNAQYTAVCDKNRF